MGLGSTGRRPTSPPYHTPSSWLRTRTPDTGPSYTRFLPVFPSLRPVRTDTLTTRGREEEDVDSLLGVASETNDHRYQGHPPTQWRSVPVVRLS